METGEAVLADGQGSLRGMDPAPRRMLTGGAGIGGHAWPVQGTTNEWLTPPGIIEALGSFDLDPCATERQAVDGFPWRTARSAFSIRDDGLNRPWEGRVWLNPPYGPETGRWLRRLADHGNGIALIFARTETEAFHQFVWRRASAILFLAGRLNFYHADGHQARRNAGGPSCLIAYDRNALGRYNTGALEAAARTADIPGVVVTKWKVPGLGDAP